jgi:hypothetical protein
MVLASRAAIAQASRSHPAAENSTAGESATSAAQTITVTDPPFKATLRPQVLKATLTSHRSLMFPCNAYLFGR